MPPLPTPHRAGTRDGVGAGDHDRPFSFGRRPCALWPYPFTTIQYARLLLLRSRWQAGMIDEDDRTLGSGELETTASADRSRTPR
ncbi:MAG: hypothetical protein JO023_04595 [Chloroflexi bacterium]|nr:hypothetical protein [Chloroflexota bacterium]